MLCTVQLLSHYYFEKIVTLYTYIYLCNEHTTHRDVKASRPKFWPWPRNLWPQPLDPFASVSSFWPRPQNLIAFSSYGTWCP